MGIGPQPERPSRRLPASGWHQVRPTAHSAGNLGGWTGVFFALRHPPPYSAELPVSCYWARHSTQGFVLRRRVTELLYMRRTGDNG